MHVLRPQVTVLALRDLARSSQTSDSWPVSEAISTEGCLVAVKLILD